MLSKRVLVCVFVGRTPRGLAWSFRSNGVQARRLQEDRSVGWAPYLRNSDHCLFISLNSREQRREFAVERAAHARLEREHDLAHSRDDVSHQDWASQPLRVTVLRGVD